VSSKPVSLFGTGESVETTLVSQIEDFTSSGAFRIAGPKAFAEAGIIHNDVDHLMIYDAFAHLPIYRLEDLGLMIKRLRRQSSSMDSVGQGIQAKPSLLLAAWTRSMLLPWTHLS
jgi:hypothetical protein